MNSRDVAIVIYWSEEDQCFIGKAELPVPGCHGDTRAEALENALIEVTKYFNFRSDLWKPKPYPRPYVNIPITTI